MNPQTLDALQIIWEQLNASLGDIELGDPNDAIPAIQDCINRLEALGIHKE